MVTKRRNLPLLSNYFKLLEKEDQLIEDFGYLYHKWYFIIQFYFDLDSKDIAFNNVIHDYEFNYTWLNILRDFSYAVMIILY